MGASEVVITRMNRVRALRLREDGRRGSQQLVRIVENPAPYLTVVLFLTLLCTIGGAHPSTAFPLAKDQRPGPNVATAGGGSRVVHPRYRCGAGKVTSAAVFSRGSSRLAKGRRTLVPCCGCSTGRLPSEASGC